jgi:hypothetical protein
LRSTRLDARAAAMISCLKAKLSAERRAVEPGPLAGSA